MSVWQLINAQARAWLRDVESLSCSPLTSVALVRVVENCDQHHSCSDAGTPACPKWQRVSHLSKLPAIVLSRDRSSTPMALGSIWDLDVRALKCREAWDMSATICNWQSMGTRCRRLAAVLFRFCASCDGSVVRALLSQMLLVLDLAMLWHLLTILSYGRLKA